MLAVRRAIATETTALAKKLGFTGDAAGDVISVVATGSDLLQEKNPGREFKARMNRHDTANLATHIAEQWGKGIETESFELDLNRTLDVTLGGKQLPKPLNEARDAIVDFLTGGKQKTYDGADETTKKKARILMSVMNQGTIVLHAAIGKAPCGAEGGVARELLEANAALREKSGAVLCQDPETKAFAAIRPVPLQMADSDTLAEVVADLVQTATTLGSVFVYNGQQHAPLRISNRHLQPRTTPWAESTP